MSNLTILRSYAQKTNLASLPSSVLLSHSQKSLTIFDAYPKSMFHFLILPRVTPHLGLTVFDLASLRTLLKADKAKAKEVMTGLNEDAQTVKGMIQDEMMKRYGFKWDVWMGFHTVPSMESVVILCNQCYHLTSNTLPVCRHVHVHVISADLCSPAMKTKKHYNSFNPKHGFFLHLNDVLSWFDAEPSYYKTVRSHLYTPHPISCKQNIDRGVIDSSGDLFAFLITQMSKLKKSQYEPLLKDDLVCWRCGHSFKNMPTLKAHLQEEWDQEAKAEKAKLERKRKREELSGDLVEQNESKRRETGVQQAPPDP